MHLDSVAKPRVSLFLGDRKRCPKTAPTDEPSKNTLKNKKEKAAWDQSQSSAEHALDVGDFLEGATHFNLRGTTNRAKFKYSKTALYLQTGPFEDSACHCDKYVNIYEQD